MSEAPAPVEAVPEQQEGGEQGSGGPGENYGEGVDAFNDQCSQRPDSGGMDDQGDYSEGFEGGQEGDDSFFEGDGGSDFSEGGEEGVFVGDQGGEGSQPSEQGFDNGPESQDTSEEPPPPEDGQEGPVDAGGLGETDQEGGEANEPEGGDQSGGEGDDDQTGDGSENKQESPSNMQDKQRENDKSSQSEKGKKPPPGDNMLSRLARGEGTKEDLKKMEKDRKKQNSGSAVPKGDWLPKSKGGGSKHAQPKESMGSSKLEKYQKEMKAKSKKWDETQTWNNNIIQRAKAQHEKIMEGVQKVGQKK